MRKRGKGTGNSGRTAGSGGRVRRGLEGKGPTPKAEDRPYHKAYRSRSESESAISPSRGRGRRKPPGEERVRQNTKGAGAEWIIGRNPVYEALQADLPVRRAFMVEGTERDSRVSDILKLAAEKGLTLMQASRRELDNLTGGAVHQGVALQMPEYTYAHPPTCSPRRWRPTTRSWWPATPSPTRGTSGRSSGRRRRSERAASSCLSGARRT